MNRRIVPQLLVALLGIALLPATLSAAPLVYVQLLARQDGTTNPFSNTIAAGPAGTEYDWMVVATLAPAGTTNTNLPTDSLGKQQIGTWQYNTNTGVGDGLGAILFALFQTPTNTTQVTFQNSGWLGNTPNQSHAGIDTNIANSLITNSNAGTFGNASFAGGVQTANYTYASQTGTQTPTGVTQAASGNAMWQKPCARGPASMEDLYRSVHPARTTI